MPPPPRNNPFKHFMPVNNGRGMFVGLCERHQGEPLHQEAALVRQQVIKKVLGLYETQMDARKK